MALLNAPDLFLTVLRAAGKEKDSSACLQRNQFEGMSHNYPFLAGMCCALERPGSYSVIQTLNTLLPPEVVGLGCCCSHDVPGNVKAKGFCLQIGERLVVSFTRPAV